MISRSRALSLLMECDGDDIWPIDYCMSRGVPESWIAELRDSFESGFNRLDQTIFLDGELVNQLHGIRDVDLARKIGQHLGVDTQSLESFCATRQALVAAIKEAIEEG